MSQPILSICVPTYNRCSLLQESIQSILAAVCQFESKVEIIIADNASNDDTAAFVGKLQERHPLIKYEKVLINIPDEIFFKAAAWATGEYVWVFADDDIMEPNAIERVLQELQKSYDLLILNYALWDQEVKKIIRPRRYNYYESFVLNDANHVLETFSMGLQFITSIVIRKDVFFLPRLLDYRILHATGNSFLYAIYSGIKYEVSAFFISDFLIRYRGYNSDLGDLDKWYSFFVIGNNKLLRQLKEEGYAPSSINKARNKIIKEEVFNDIVSRKKSNIKAFRILRKIPSEYYSNMNFLFICLPVLLMPNWLFSKMLALYKYFKG